MIEPPYLLYCGDAADPLAVKTARGIATWRPGLAIGQHRAGPEAAGVGLEDLSIADAATRGARTMVVGVANAGGVLSQQAVADVLAALRAGMDVAAGLHDRLARQPAIAAEAAALGRRVWDVREPPAALTVGTGAPRVGRRLLTVGTDCAVGKMYTTLAIERELRARGVDATFRATGQTGILITGSGIPIDAVVSDFVAGAAEALAPARDDGGWDVIEGQGSLFHPAFAGVSLGLLHGAQPCALVLCHEAGRTATRHLSGYALPSLRDCLRRNLEAAWLTSPDAQAVGVALNTAALTPREAAAARRAAEDETGLPCEDPVATGVERIVDRLLATFSRQGSDGALPRSS